MNRPCSALWFLLCSLASSPLVVGQAKCQIGSPGILPANPSFESSYDESGRYIASDYGNSNYNTFDYGDFNYSDFDYNDYDHRGYGANAYTTPKDESGTAPQGQSDTLGAATDGSYTYDYEYEHYEYGNTGESENATGDGTGEGRADSHGEYGYGSYEFDGYNDFGYGETSEESSQQDAPGPDSDGADEDDKGSGNELNDVDDAGDDFTNTDPAERAHDARGSDTYGGGFSAEYPDELRRNSDSDIAVRNTDDIRFFLSDHDDVYDKAVYGVVQTASREAIASDGIDNDLFDPAGTQQGIDLAEEFTDPVAPPSGDDIDLAAEFSEPESPSADEVIDFFEEFADPDDTSTDQTTDPAAEFVDPATCPERNVDRATLTPASDQVRPFDKQDYKAELYRIPCGGLEAWGDGCETWYRRPRLSESDQTLVPVAAIISQTAPIWHSLGLVNLATMVLDKATEVSPDGNRMLAPRLRSVVDPHRWITEDGFLSTTKEPLTSAIVDCCDVQCAQGQDQVVLIEAAETLEGLSSLLTDMAGQLRRLAEAKRISLRVQDRDQVTR